MTDKPIRFDKWLWAARFFKTRALAKQAIEGGKVHYNGARAKVSKTAEIGATLIIRQGWDEKTVVIKALSDQRRGADVASQLYEETEESVAKRDLNAEQRKLQRAALAAPEHRPNKKQRRQIVRFKNVNDPE
jgi:ribosome-associated heat shock protein Hsp15